MFAGPHVETILFVGATDCGEVEVLHHTCEIAVNVQQRNANCSCVIKFWNYETAHCTLLKEARN